MAPAGFVVVAAHPSHLVSDLYYPKLSDWHCDHARKASQATVCSLGRLLAKRDVSAHLFLLDRRFSGLASWPTRARTRTLTLLTVSISCWGRLQ